MRKFLALPIIALAGVAGGCALPTAAHAPSLPGPAPVAKPACEPGEIVVHGDEPTPCDLIGGANTLTILDITEAECNDFGGRWWYEACLDTDF